MLRHLLHQYVPESLLKALLDSVKLFQLLYGFVLVREPEQIQRVLQPRSELGIAALENRAQLLHVYDFPTHCVFENLELARSKYVALHAQLLQLLAQLHPVWKICCALF